MNDFGFNDYNALFQRMYGPKPEKDKGGWLDPALTLAGTLAGAPLGPAGMAAGSSLGHAAGGVARSAANGDASGAISRAVGLPAFWQQFAPYIGTFAEGGPVPGGQMPWWVRAGATQADPQAVLNQFGGPEPTPFVPQQPSHPTLEMLASVIPQVLNAMPKPANPKNTKAIGAWLPAMSAAISAPANYAQAKREKANTQGQEQYDAQVEARNKRMAAAAPQVAAAMFREPRTVGQSMSEIDRPMTAEESQQITGSRAWDGYTLRQYQARQRPVGTSATQDVPLTGDALLMEANKYLATGDITSFGRDQKNRVRILNVAASLRRGETPDVALAKAEYGADRKSFTEMRVNLDAVTAFEKTALKNADVFISAMQSIPDTGVPALNTPLRLMSDRGLGSPELAAFNAARRTIIPEFARILSNPRLVGQLTDQSRREVDEIIAGNATLNQALQTLQVLKQDAANRREAYQSQLSEIRGRIRDRNSVSTQGQPSQGGGGFQWPQSSLAPTGGK